MSGGQTHPGAVGKAECRPKTIFHKPVQLSYSCSSNIWYILIQTDGPYQVTLGAIDDECAVGRLIGQRVDIPHSILVHSNTRTSKMKKESIINLFMNSLFYARWHFYRNPPSLPLPVRHPHHVAMHPEHRPRPSARLAWDHPRQSATSGEPGFSPGAGEKSPVEDGSWGRHPRESALWRAGTDI